MTKVFLYSLSALVVIAGFTACSSSSSKTNNQPPEIAVSSNNQIPVAVIKASTEEAVLNQGIVFDASDSYDGDGDKLTYEWKDENGKLLSTQKKINRLFTTEGQYSMTLYVIDEKGGVASDTINIKVSRNNNNPTSNQPPVALATVSATDIDSGESVHFADNGSYDPDGSIVKYEWRDMDGILLSDTKTLDRTLYYRPQYDFNNDGTTKYIKTLYVTDDKGVVSSISFTIIVHKLSQNQPPVVDLGSDKNILAGQSVTLRAEASDPDGVIDYYIWKKNGVVVAEGPYMSTFTTDNLATGTHTYTVTVRDNNGEETTDTIDVVVSVTGASGGSTP